MISCKGCRIFDGIVAILDTSERLQKLNYVNLPLFSPTDITYYEITDIIYNLKDKDSKDYYGINIETIIAIINIIVYPITDSYNQFLQEGDFPSIFKISKVALIFKEDNRNYLSFTAPFR